MSSPDRTKGKPTVKTVAIVVLLVAALAALYVQLAPQRAPTVTYAFFYDLDSGSLIVHEDQQLPPVMGGKAVKATVFSCGKCSDKSTHFIGYLEKYTDDAKEAQAQLAQQTNLQAPPTPGLPPPPVLNDRLLAGHLVAAAPTDKTDIKWLPMNKPEGFAITNIAARCPAPQKPTPCAAKR